MTPVKAFGLLRSSHFVPQIAFYADHEMLEIKQTV